MFGWKHSSARSGGAEDSSPASGRTALYRIVYDESVRALQDQTDEWNGLRGRVGTFMALVASATAFLVGTGIRNGERDGVFYGFAVAGTVAFVVALGAAAWALVPTSGWKMRANVQTLRGVALAQNTAREANEVVLRKLRNLYFLVILSGTVALGLWITLVWLRAKSGTPS